MNDTDKLQRVLSHVKFGFYLTINQHRDYYQTIEDWVEESLREKTGLDESEASEILSAQKDVVELQIYPESAGSFFILYGSSVGNVLDRALEILEC